MAESGQSDGNRILPTFSPEVDKRPEWKKERGRMLSFIVEKTMEEMSDEECRRKARGTVSESLMYTPDHTLITKYEKCGGEWTEIMMDKYRAKVEEPTPTSSPSGSVADEGISDEAREEKEELRDNLYK